MEVQKTRRRLMWAGAVFAAGLASAQPVLPGLNRALPTLDGDAIVDTLGADVVIERDAIGVVSVSANDELDAARGLGFVHAQERFLQMDVSRRLAAGRLAEMAGPDVAAMDQRYRAYNFKAVVAAAHETLPVAHQELLAAYADGVNAGLADLGEPPLAHGLIGIEVEPWTPHDSLLVIATFFDGLHDDAQLEPMRGALVDAVPEELSAWLLDPRDRTDLLLIHPRGPEQNPMIPGPGVIDLREADGDDANGISTTEEDQTPLAALPDFARPKENLPGSNGWVVSSARTKHDGALLASDMHLQLTAPGVWFRADLLWGDSRVVGLSLPGMPGIVAGSNGSVAWGFTNTTGDFQDLVVIDVHPDDRLRYRVGDEWRTFDVRTETIRVADSEDITYDVRDSIWGPVWTDGNTGVTYSLAWTALQPGAMNIASVDFAHATTVEEALDVGARWMGPSQNVMVAAADGRIGWTLSGWLPERNGHDGVVPVRGPDGPIWKGPRPESQRPRIVDPANGVIVTANNRTLPRASAARLGSSWSRDGRAARIYAMIVEGDGGPGADARLTKLDEGDHFAIQLDTRVTRLDPWAQLVRRAAKVEPSLQPALDAVNAWNGRADLDSVGVELLGDVRRLARRVLLSRIIRGNPDSAWRIAGSSRTIGDERVLQILEARPAHLLPSDFESWDEFEVEMVRDVMEDFDNEELVQPWGTLNRFAVEHPFSDVFPPFATVLNMEESDMAGHPSAVRVMTEGFGASNRMVVIPGREDDGICQIPAGQSGHPASPFYRAGHRAWIEGAALPLVRRAIRSTLTLRPE